VGAYFWTANKTKSKSLEGKIFLKLFAEHILPKGFVRIRHVGFLSSRSKKKNLALIKPIPKPRLTIRQFILLTTGKEPYQCPCCNKGEMVIVSILPAIRGSPTSSMYILNGKQFRTILLFILFTILNLFDLVYLYVQRKKSPQILYFSKSIDSLVEKK